MSTQAGQRISLAEVVLDEEAMRRLPEPQDYSTGPTTAEVIRRLDAEGSGIPHPSDAPERKYVRRTFAQVAADALREAGVAA